jgi:hypothetical protein
MRGASRLLIIALRVDLGVNLFQIVETGRIVDDFAATDPQPPVPVLDGFDFLGAFWAENLIHRLPASQK